MGITLANFQLKAIEALMEAMGEPNRDIILKSCTGSGKTIILTHFMDEYLKSTNKDKAKGKIKRIKIIGTNDAGSFEVDTNITGMKHFLKVKGESVTNEVESSDFFVKAQEFIASMGGRI